MNEYKGEVPFVRLLLPLMCGILVAYVRGNEFIFRYSITILVSLFAVFVALLSGYRKFNVYRYERLPGLLVCSLLFMFGYYITVRASQQFDRHHFSKSNASLFVGVVTSEPVIRKGISRCELSIMRGYEGYTGVLNGKLMLSVKQEHSETPVYNYGDILIIPADYDSIEPPYNPGEFDYRSYLADRQIFFQAFLDSHQIKVVNRGRGNPLIAHAIGLRKSLVDKFRKYIPDPESAAFASTLILGYRAELSQELINAYSKTGTMHVLSVSGMHVGIVFVVLSLLLKGLDKSNRGRVLRAFVIIMVVWFYAMISGFSAPASRAAAMLSFVVLGKALNKNQNTYNLIAISAFFLLIYNPFSLVDAGFQLSYFAVLGIVYFHAKIHHAIYIRNRYADYIWSYCALSIAAQLSTFPISIYYFHQFPVYFLLSNLLIMLPVAIIMYMGIVFMFLTFSGGLSITGHILNGLINLTNDILYYMEDLPFAIWGGIWINRFECLMIYLVIFSIILRLSFQYRRSMLFASVIMIGLALSISIKRLQNLRTNEIIFFSLRKNTAFGYISATSDVVVSDLAANDKNRDFSIVSTLEKVGTTDHTFYQFDDIFEKESSYGGSGFYQFGGYKIVRWREDWNKRMFDARLKVNAVVLSDNSKADLDLLKNTFTFDILIINANNPTYKVDKWIEAAAKENTRYYVLKKNHALIVKL